MNQSTSSHVNDDTITEAAAQWFLRLQDEDCTDAERNTFAQWLAADPRHAREYEAMRTLWAGCEGLTPSVQAPTGKTPAVPGRRLANKYKRMFSFAAALTVSLVVGWHQSWIPYDYDSHEAAATTRMVTLPDGSRVELNLNTRLTYARYRDRRMVSLDNGEAFFEVAHDALHPFIVQVGEGSIEATGTRFNVWLYQQQVHVILVDGAVQVTSDRSHPERSVRLAPGMQADYWPGVKQAQLSQTRTTDASLAWRYGKLVFNDLPLHQALPLINRYLSTPVMLADKATGDLRLGLSYNTREMSALVSTLPQVLPVQVTHNAQGNPVLHRQTGNSPRG